MATNEPRHCDHSAAVCVDSTDVKDEGRFVEHYECPCGATGTIRGNEQDPAHAWTQSGEVFRSD